MVIRNVTVNDCAPETIVIGRRGTFETMQIVFDLTYLIENYGDGAAVLALKRSQDSSAYPAVASQDGNTLTWVVSEVDTYYVGAGVCQLMWYVDGGLAKTIIYPLVVMRDILSTSEEAPDAYQEWVDDLTALGAETLENARNAAQSASEAESAKDDAVAAKEAAEEAAETAQEAVVHAPIIQNGYWYIWNDGEYVDTGVRAEGQKGDKGDTGEKGDTGNGIASITKTGTAGLVDTYTVTYTDGTTTTFTVTNGAKGDKGDTGATGNGIASITKTGTSGNVDTYTITYTNDQTTTFTVTNGAVSSVAGKTGAVTLNANDVAFYDSGTYDDGTVGKELSDQKNAIDENDIDIVALTSMQWPDYYHSGRFAEYPLPDSAFEPIGVKIYSDGQNFATSYNPQAHKNSGGTTWFFAPDGNNANDGLTPQTAKQSFASINSRVADGDTLYLLHGLYGRSLHSGFVVKKSVNIIGNNSIVTNADNNYVYALDSETGLYSTARSNVCDVIINLGKDNYAQLKAVYSVANCVATPLSFFSDSSTLYLNTDGTIPTNDNTYLNLVLANHLISCKSDSSDCNVYMENLTLIGGNRGTLLCESTDDYTLTIHAVDCKFIGAFTSSAISHDAVSLIGAKGYFTNCEASFARKDGFNYHALNSKLSYGFEQNCIGRNNGHDWTENNCNGSTSHDGCPVIRINGFYHDNKGPNICDVQPGTKTLNLRCVAFNSKSTDTGNSADFKTEQNGATMWLDCCKAFGSDWSAFAVTGTTMYLHDTEVKNTNGNGTIVQTWSEGHQHLNAGDVDYDDSVTYAAGTVGAALTSQKNAISQNEEAIADTQSMIATVEATTTASKNYSVGDLIVYDGKLYKVTSAIATGATIIVGSNVTQTTVGKQIASGGGGRNETYRQICDVTLTEAASQILRTADENGNSFRLKKIYVVLNLVSTGTTSIVKLAGVADAGIYAQTLANYPLSTPATDGKQNNYSFAAEFLHGISGSNVTDGEWILVGIPSKGENRNNADVYTAPALPTEGSWNSPIRNDFGYMTAIKLISVTSYSLGVGTRIRVWGVDA